MNKKTIKKSKKKKNKKASTDKSMYSTPIGETCHMGYECGKIGLTCKSANCPYT